MNRQRFLLLDGMRGVAAILVVGYHIANALQMRWRPEHAYMAVDFFFCLSGFVIAAAYDERMKAGLGLRDFLRLRLFRLYPMIGLGVLLGSLVLVIQWYVEGAPAGSGVLTWFLLTIGGLSLLPSGFLLGLSAYPVNPPIWSLAFELFANTLYGLRVGGKLKSPKSVALVMAALAGLLIMTTLRAVSIGQIGQFSVLAFVEGPARVLFPFFAGVVIWRSALFERGARIPDYILVSGLILLLGLPIFALSHAYELVFLLACGPFMVWAGARSRVTTWLEGLWNELGRISYPLYLVHMPVCLFLILVFHRTTDLQAPLIGGICMIASLVIAWGAANWEETMRSWLSGLLTARMGSIAQ